MENNIEIDSKLSNGMVCENNLDCKSNECLHGICVISNNNNENIINIIHMIQLNIQLI